MNSSNNPVVKLSGVSKLYGVNKALSNVDFSCYKGEVHAILGENGAGKSTLIKIISGVVQPTAGIIEIDGVVKSLDSPSLSARQGLICMFQELSLVPDLSVRENLLLSYPGSGLGLLNNSIIKDARNILDSIDGTSIRMSQKVSSLTLSERQQVEITKAITRKPKLLILDESTSALNSSVVDKVFNLIRKERDKGVSILFISHRFHEIEALADKVSIFRNGTHVETFDNGFYDYSSIINKMVGERVDDIFPPKRSNIGSSEKLLELKNYTWNERFKNVSMSVKKGQITGLGGLDGQGQNEVILGLFGLLKKTTGSVLIEDKKVYLKGPKVAKSPDLGVALVPEDRKTEGLILEQSIRQNLELAALGIKGINAKDNLIYKPFLEALELKCNDLNQKVSELSGGNQQKVALSKWLALSPKCMLLADPTRGIDVKTKSNIYFLLRELADNGVAILLLSTDFEELVHLCDETHIFYDGEVVSHLSGANVTAENIIAQSLNIKSGSTNDA